MGKDKKQNKNGPAPAAEGKKKGKEAKIPVKDGGVEKPKKKKSDDIDAIFNAAKKAKAIVEEETDQVEEEDGGAGPSGRHEVDEDDAVDEALMKELAAKIKQGRKKTVAKADGKAAGTGGHKDDLFGSGALSGRKRTEEGYAIFKENELGANKKDAGMTADCPFDCDCCYVSGPSS